MKEEIEKKMKKGIKRPKEVGMAVKRNKEVEHKHQK